MTKSEVLVRIAAMPDEGPQLAAIVAILAGKALGRAEERHTLKEISGEVRKHTSWLHRLGVPEVCGEWLGGRRSYNLDKVVAYLASPACRARIAEIREERKKGAKLRKEAARA